MKSDAPEVSRELDRAERAIRKQFKACRDFGLHPDEFWYLLIRRVDPRPRVRPRQVSRIQEVKRRSADKARLSRQEKNFDRNQKIRAHYETSLKVGDQRAAIYRKLSKLYDLKERQLRTICRRCDGRES
jgi:hypothetical protein